MSEFERYYFDKTLSDIKVSDSMSECKEVS